MKVLHFIILMQILLSTIAAQIAVVEQSINLGLQNTSLVVGIKNSEKKDSSLSVLGNKAQIEFLPIIMYDTDIGFGYGGKTFLLNQLGFNESVDVTLFNSTKGERWYRLVYSMPDFEFRQRKIYPVSLDVIFDYDKMIRNNFFGIGSVSNYSDREYYTKEPFEVSLVIGRGFTKSIIGQVGLKYKTIKSTNYDSFGLLLNSKDIFQLAEIKYSSFNISLRFDNRDSFINPTYGNLVSIESEFTIPLIKGNVDFLKIETKFQKYLKIPIFNSILAFRIQMTNILGDNQPAQLLLPLGGTNTLRGFPAERFLDKNSLITNVELRVPLYLRIGGVIGLDAGNVFPELKKFRMKSWKINSALGLRLLMDTFVARLDIGISNETIGLYFNFSQLF